MNPDGKSGSSDRVQQLIAAVSDELIGALRRADLLRAEAEAAREALQQVAAERLRFFQYANHEMRSPLAVLLGRAEIAKRKLARGQYGEVAESLEQIQAQAVRLRDLIDRLLRLTQPEHGASEPEDVDLAVVIEQAVDRFRGSTDRHRFVVEPMEHPLPVHGYRVELEEVFENLLSNATKYSPEGGEISVGASVAVERPDGLRVVVRITDEGPGIPEEHRPLLFEPFYRAPAERNVPGSGLGLAICAETMRRHEGRIWLDATSERGTTFALALPLRSASAQSADIG